MSETSESDVQARYSDVTSVFRDYSVRLDFAIRLLKRSAQCLGFFKALVVVPFRVPE